VGKAYVPLEILNKPGSLSSAESAIMRAHPQLGYDALTEAGYAVEPVLDAVLHHHERLDGSGYPNAFSGQEISRITRIASVADVYDAVTSQRVYHSAMAPTAALRMIRKRAGIDFDSSVAQALIKVVGIYPIGSLVRLSSGHLAVVSEQNAVNTAKPKVLAIYSLKKEAYINPLPLDLAESDDAIESDEDPAEWGVDVRRYWHL
jgi:HD-GYP domain-containing protein (c-di-GMP phosphodiesterase class II)